MGAKNYSGVRKVERAGRTLYVVDFRYTDLGGRKQRYTRDASIQTHAASHAEAKRLMARAAETGSPLEKKGTGLTLSEFASTVYERDYMPTYRPATAKRYRALLKLTILSEFGARALDGITSADYREYAAKLIKSDVAPKGPLNLVRSILRAAEDRGLIVVAPTVPKGLIKTSKKLPEAPSPVEVKTMLTADGWVLTAIHLGALAGLRSGEVRALEVGDVDFVNGCINVRRAISGDESDAKALTPKSGHERIVPMTETLAAHLTEACRNKLPKARVVTNSQGLSPRRQELLHAHQVALGKLTLKEWSFHSLRHYFISQMIRLGVGLEAVRVLAGHGSLAVTQRYAHATGDDLRSAIAKLG